MRKDPTEFERRFLMYKNGKMPYENGLPKYDTGTVPKNKFDAFVLQMGPSLYRALLRYGVQNREAAFANMMRLLALESNYGTSDQAINNNNFGGVGFNPNTNSYYSYKDIDAFTDAYVKLMNSRYRKALDVYDPREYTKIVHGLGYFGYPNDPKKDAEALLEYLNNMATMRSLNTALANHVRSNPDIYPREGFINGTPKSIYRPEQDKVIVPFWAPTLNIDPQEELKVELAPPTMIQRPQEEPETVLAPTIVDKLKEALQVFDMFGLNNSKKKSSLPELIPDLDEYMKLEQENYFRDIMGVGDVYDNLYAYNSRLPKPLEHFESGKVPKAILTVNNSNAEFVDRLKSNWRDEIWDWEGSGKAVTHKISSADNIVYPKVLKVNGGLIDFTHPIWKGIVNPYWNAIKTGNYVEMDSEDDAKWFGPNYKKYYPSFKNGKLPKFEGGLLPFAAQLFNIGAGAGNSVKAAARQRLYNNVTPWGYNIPNAALEFLKGQRKFSMSSAKEALWAKYLGLPQFNIIDETTKGNVDDWIVESPYTPSMGGITYGNKAFRLNPEKFNTTFAGSSGGPLNDENIRTYFKKRLEQNRNNVSYDEDFGNSGLGYYTMSSGKDDNGYYISYYDDWDINPLHGKSAQKWTQIFPDALKAKGDILKETIGTNPFTLYDRRYLTEDEWKALGGYANGKLPMFANGGIHINPANRGKFNATKKRTGKTTEELTHSKNPLTRKRAIFAQNAKKWKH